MKVINAFSEKDAVCAHASDMRPQAFCADSAVRQYLAARRAFFEHARLILTQQIDEEISEQHVQKAILLDPSEIGDPQ